MCVWNSYPENSPRNEGEYIVTQFGFVTRNRYYEVGNPVVRTIWFGEKSPFNQSIIAWAIGKPYNPSNDDPQFIGHSLWHRYPDEKPIDKNIYLTTMEISNKILLLAILYDPDNYNENGLIINHPKLKELINYPQIEGPISDPWENVIAWALCNPYNPNQSGQQYL